jgi:hypothetical protein
MIEDVATTTAWVDILRQVAAYAALFLLTMIIIIVKDRLENG